MSTNLYGSTHTRSALAAGSIEIRSARAADRDALERVAERDSAVVPAGSKLVAEVDGEIAAAIAIESGRAIADPFRRTAAALELLRSRARQLGRRRMRPLRVVARTPSPDPAGVARRAA